MGLFDDLGKPPIEVSADKKASAQEMFETYTSFTDAGFSKDQALALVNGIIQAAVQAQAMQQGDDE